MALSVVFRSSFVSTNQTKGRPKKPACANAVLEEKRCSLDAEQGKPSVQLTGLYLLWARKQINKQQFIAGCYYEELHFKLERSLGNLSKQRESTIAKVHAVHMSEMNNKLAQFTINEQINKRVQRIEEMIGYVHDKALSIMRKVLLSCPLESAQEVKNLTYQDLGIFKQTLTVIDRYLETDSKQEAGYLALA